VKAILSLKSWRDNAKSSLCQFRKPLIADHKADWPKALGGVKKKSLASMEKSQESTGTGQEEAAAKGKKTKEQKAAPQQKRQLAFLPPKMSEAEMMKTLAPLKAITVYSASKALGVNASVASTLLKELETKSMITRAGGFSGHGVWFVRR
jgi:small subunit ribosomal protein S25e